MEEIVWLTDERCFAVLVKLGAHFSTVRYNKEGIDYEVIVFNDEFDYYKGDDNDED